MVDDLLGSSKLICVSFSPGPDIEYPLGLRFEAVASASLLAPFFVGMLVGIDFGDLCNSLNLLFFGFVRLSIVLAVLVGAVVMILGATRSVVSVVILGRRHTLGTYVEVLAEPAEWPSRRRIWKAEDLTHGETS